MKSFLTLIFLIFSMTPIHARQTLDSLNRILRSTSHPDTTKVNAYNELAWEWAGKDPKMGLLYADSGFLLAKSIGFESGRIAAINRRGVNYWYSGQDSLAISSYEEVLAYHLKLENLKGQASAINNIALLQYNRGDYRLALENHQQATQIFDQLGLRKNLINSLSNEGVVFLALSDYPRALELFLKALAKTEEEDTWEKGNLLNNLGLVHKNLGEYGEAKKYYFQALDLYRKTENQQTEALALGNLSAVAQLQKDYTEAQTYLEQALAINKKIGNSRRIASDFSSLGNLYLSKNQAEKSLQYLDSARRIYENLEENLSLSSVLIQLAQAKEKIGDKPGSLYSLEKKALKAAQKSGSLEAQQSAWSAISKREDQLGDFRNSLLSFRQATLFKDSIFNQDNEKRLIRAQLGYEYDLREKDLKAGFDVERSLLESEKKREQLKASLYLMGIGALLLIGGGGFLAIRQQQKIRQERVESEFRAQVAELELKALKAQMNPHFIFNALSSISNFLLKNQADQADRYLTRFSRLIRRILEYSEVREISLAMEADLLRDYIAIESLRLGKPVEFQLIPEEGVEVDKLMIPPLILQPLVENSLWHGIANSGENGLITLKVFRQDEGFLLVLRDNGAGIREAVQVQEKHQSMGMRLVKNRLENLSKAKKTSSWSVFWENLAPGFEVRLSFSPNKPLNLT